MRNFIKKNLKKKLLIAIDSDDPYDENINKLIIVLISKIIFGMLIFFLNCALKIKYNILKEYENMIIFKENILLKYRASTTSKKITIDNIKCLKIIFFEISSSFDKKIS